MIRRSRRAALPILLLAAAASSNAMAKCRMEEVAALPVRVTAQRILIDARINGQPAAIILDTGAQASLVFAEAAHRLVLPTSDAFGSGQMLGIGGVAVTSRVRVRELSFGEVKLKDIVLPSGGSASGESVDMLLGQDVLAHWNVEYDLAHGAVRLLHPNGCRGDEVAYWADSYAKAPMQTADGGGEAIRLMVQLNGRAVEATLDTGAPESLVDLQAARRAGAQVTPAGTATVGGLGRDRIGAEVADIAELTVGQEAIKAVRIQVAPFANQYRWARTGRLIGDVGDLGEMLLGLDFIRSHRLMIAPDQRMIYFTYAGGPIFHAPAGPPPG